MIEFVGDEDRRRVSIELDGGDASPALIKVIGIGGGGSNAVNRMIAAGVRGVDYMACNTDLQALRKAVAPIKMQIGSRLTKGLGAGADPDVGRNAALEDQEKLAEALKGADMVFIAAGLGGGTGSGAGPIIAKIAAESGALTVAVVTKPFQFEGKKRMRQAERAAKELREHVDTLITIPNQRLLSFVENKTPLADSFKIADDVLRQAIQGISDLINCPGEINLDFADVKKIMSDMGRALMGTATASGENRAVHAAQAAISSPLLEDASIEGARGVLMNITGGPDLTLYEVNEAAEIIQQAADPDAEILFGCVHDDSMAGAVKVTVIATGFDRPDLEENLQIDDEQPRPAVPRPHKTFLRGDDSGGFGPNASTTRDDFDIPTVLRRQMD
ncbi:MAG TPA: cell division protein FtsZ [Thermoanaerobaculia bacterium]|nr:cell division protein FtsZ [Thermoanaerobaculia bacterium]